jgi:hypothetical protein
MTLADKIKIQLFGNLNFGRCDLFGIWDSRFVICQLAVNLTQHIQTVDLMKASNGLDISTPHSSQF